jgi:Tol biopolymer transport system component/DNA-binding winged helix-turn-helix (wHTH) protein
VPEFSANGNGSDGKIRFGLFEADLHSAELRKAGRKIKLQDQPFQILAMLLERPAEIVTRDELRAALWPVDTFVDFDHGLNAAVKRLRDALGDSADNPRFVETLARRGYRFIAPVTVQDASPDPELASSPEVKSVPTSPTRTRHWRVVLSSLAVLLMGSGAGWVAARRFNPTVPIAELRLTANAPDDPILSAAISPDAKYLAFSDRSGLFLRVISTGETHALPLPDGFQPRPAGWFPDSSHVLVTKSRDLDGGPSLWSVSVLGGQPHKLMEEADGRSVSPDGSQIAFVRGSLLREEVWIMSADGDHPRKVFGETGDMFGSVAWSPDSQRLAFVRHSYKSGFKMSQSSLWIVDPDTGLANPILTDFQLGEALAWAAGSRLIYSLSEPLPNQSDSNLWAVCVDPRSARMTSQPARLTSGPDKKVRLSVSADGKQLSFLRWRGEPHVYVADVDSVHDRLSAAHPLGLDEGRNLPFAWTPDNKQVLFTSDRDGTAHVFKQAADQPAPDLVVGGPDYVQIARLDPDGSELLYLLVPPWGDNSGVGRLMGVPLSGGTPRLVLQENQLHNFQCARSPSKTCIFSISTSDKISFVAFDPATGNTHALDAIVPPPGGTYNWTLSPDGSTLAMADWRRGSNPAEIVLLSVDGVTATRTLTLHEWAGISHIDWAADSRHLWVGALGPTGAQALLSVDLRGRARPLLEDMQKEIGWAIPSPDGRHIAFWESGDSSNVWLLRGL